MEKIKLNTCYFPFLYKRDYFYGAQLKAQQIVKESELNNEWKAKYENYKNQLKSIFDDDTYFIIGYFYEVRNPFNCAPIPKYAKSTIQGWPKYPCVLAMTNRNTWIRVDLASVEIELRTHLNEKTELDITSFDNYKHEHLSNKFNKNIEPQEICISNESNIEDSNDIKKLDNTISSNANINSSFYSRILNLINKLKHCLKSI